ncbi:MULTISPECIES: MotA/TolQ/ExbB proton channel family protein [unclassified Agarivorans]|uniref:MotA/TolQ/ExbB proton channel family protein n=1 Tax=unclassified Agarivorans TaxID=2636026 RepID=UPI0026E21941|nr:MULTISPECIES: MotA/TolQ/ExbB proton channel family protein [unclassified Agarivorans]MDO6684510.1 MotA/TolQ/ExbB proton channel family protein [Agarivorans sp. 3_MG-2023]MDO6714675.1 MotA/TolQ/ExbB proton channel family protein [Agarivorans sp. 2_MG-2023]
MILVSLLTLASIIVAGFLLVLLVQNFTRMRFIETDEGLVWWTRLKLVKLYLCGLAAAFIFVGLFFWVVVWKANSAYETASTIDYIFSRMDYERRPSDSEELKSFYDMFASYFQAEEFEEDAAYDPSVANANINAVIIRERFLNSYIVDPSPEIMVQNPHRMMEDVVSEKIFPVEACQSTSGILLVLWAKGYGGAAFDEWNPLSDGSNQSCASLLSFENVPALAKCGVGEHLGNVASHVRERIIPSLGDAMSALLSGTFQVPSVEAIVTSAPEESNCGNLFSSSSGQQKREIIDAQISVLRESVGVPMRMGAVVFGPIQVLLLTIFFSACIGLGERRRLVKSNSEKNLELLIKERWDLVNVPGESVDKVAFEIVFQKELEDEAGFPITFAQYVLGMIGFIGTVIGIAASLSDAGSVVRASSLGVAAQEEAISNVTGLLGVAFDTTLLALGTSAVVFYIHGYLRTTENSQLRRVVGGLAAAQDE